MKHVPWRNVAAAVEADADPAAAVVEAGAVAGVATAVAAGAAAEADEADTKQDQALALSWYQAVFQHNQAHALSVFDRASLSARKPGGLRY